MTTNETAALTPHTSAACPASDLLTPGEAAGYLRSNPRTLERWRAVGGGPIYVKIGRRVAYRIGDLLHFIETRSRQSTAA